MILTDRPIYIHYGAKKFDPKIGFPISNRQGFTKPEGGLWGSRIGATFGWKQWCEIEDFRTTQEENSFQFQLRDPARVIIVSKMEDLKKLPLLEEKWDWDDSYFINFEKCLADGIDAIELCWFGDEYKKLVDDDLYWALYGWDCDSIVVLNPDAVIQV